MGALLSVEKRPTALAVLLVVLTLYLLRPRALRADADAEGTTGAAASRRAPSASGAIAVAATDLLLVLERGVPPRVLRAAADALLRIAATADVYLIVQLDVDDDGREAETLAALEAAGLFGAGRCDRRKVIFCMTEDGRGAICRQLEPGTHIETSAKVVRYLGPHLNRVVHVEVGRGGGSSLQPSTLAEACALLEQPIAQRA